MLAVAIRTTTYWLTFTYLSHTSCVQNCKTPINPKNFKESKEQILTAIKFLTRGESCHKKN